MLQETMLDSYTFYGELNWNRKSDFSGPVLLVVVCLLQREIRCRNERKIIWREGKFTEDGLFLDCLFLNSVNVLEKGLRRCSTYPFSFVWSAVTLSNKWLCSYLVKKLCILCILWSCVPASSPSSKSLHRTLSQVLMNCVESIIRLSSLHWLLLYHLPPHCISHKLCFLKHAAEFFKGLFSLLPSCAV